MRDNLNSFNPTLRTAPSTVRFRLRPSLFARRVLAAIGIAALLLSVRSAHASVQLELQLTSANNLNNLMANETLSFEVILKNDPFMDILDPITPFLNALGTNVQFDGTLLGTAFNMVAGTIVPNLGNGELALGPGVGSAQFVFDSLIPIVNMDPDPGPIESQGVLFSFDVKVQPGVTGSGTFSFDEMGTFAFDNDDNLLGVGL